MLWIDYKKVYGRRLTNTGNCMDTAIQGLKEYIKKEYKKQREIDYSSQ